MGRLTESMVDNAFRLACDAAKGAGIDTGGWVLESGSAANGVPYRLMCRAVDMARAPIGGSGGYLGYTRAEVHARLSAYREAWLVVSDQRSE